MIRDNRVYESQNDIKIDKIIGLYSGVSQCS